MAPAGLPARQYQTQISATDDRVEHHGPLQRSGVQEKLKAATTQGRKLRRTLLRGSVAVIIVAGYEGKRFIYERMKELGIRSAWAVPSWIGSEGRGRHVAYICT